MPHRPLPRPIRLTLFLVLFALVGVALARNVSVFDQFDLLVDVRHEIVSQYVEEPDQPQMVQAAVRGMVESLDDPYTIFLAPEEIEPFDKAVRGAFSGIGAEVDIHENRLRIVSPLEDSPAWKAGVMAGDTVLEIDGQSTEGMKITEAVNKLTGEEGTQVTIKVRHESGETAVFVLTRARINVQTVRGFRRDAAGKWDYLLDDQHRIGYIRLTQFTEQTPPAVRAALDELIKQDVRGIILDVRFDPGGLLESAAAIADLFLPAGQTIVSIKGRAVREKVLTATEEGTIPPIPMVILANEASASAAEILTGALSDNGRALFIGARTFGKGSVQQVKMLDSARGAIKITNAYYYLPSGRNIHRRENAEVWGVDPKDGYYVPMTPQETRELVKTRRDNDVLRANPTPGSKPENAGDSGGGVIAPDSPSPQWLRENLKDPQLAAALEAMLGKLTAGDWPVVGASGAAQLVKEQKRQTLEMQRDLLTDRLNQINDELNQLDAPAPGNADVGSEAENHSDSEAQSGTEE
jgi:carboxyl-terminal processing protease